MHTRYFTYIDHHQSWSIRFSSHSSRGSDDRVYSGFTILVTTDRFLCCSRFFFFTKFMYMWFLTYSTLSSTQKRRKLCQIAKRKSEVNNCIVELRNFLPNQNQNWTGFLFVEDGSGNFHARKRVLIIISVCYCLNCPEARDPFVYHQNTETVATQIILPVFQVNFRWLDPFIDLASDQFSRRVSFLFLHM